MITTDTASAQGRVVERVKLLALATSGNPHEAASAAAEAQRLMVEHDLSADALKDGPPQIVEHELERGAGPGRAVLWRVTLATAIGRALGVQVVYTQGTTRIQSFGRAADVAAHAALYHWLAAQLVPQCDRDWVRRPAGAGGTEQSFTAEWMIGAGREVEARMVAARTAAARASSQGESALVLLDARRAEVRSAIARYCARSGVQTARVTRAVRGAPGAYDLGAAAGARANLTPNSRTLAGRS